MRFAKLLLTKHERKGLYKVLILSKLNTRQKYSLYSSNSHLSQFLYPRSPTLDDFSWFFYPYFKCIRC
jgi:hypothetical protein